jgi:hypothetical protein
MKEEKLPQCNHLSLGGSLMPEDGKMFSFQSYLHSLLEPPTIPNVFGGSPFTVAPTLGNGWMFDKSCTLLLHCFSIQANRRAGSQTMNTQTLILTVMIFWLVMGLAFLSAYSEVKRTGGTLVDAMRNNESFFFIVSLVIGVVIIAFKLA